MKCIATTARGMACRKSARFGAECLGHAARSGNPQAVEVMRENGRKGMATRIANIAAGKRQGCSLRTTDDLLSELERALVLVERSGTDAATKATSIVKIVSTAKDVLRTTQAEDDTKTLAKLLLERHPELAQYIPRHLRSVK
jgi:hypothetical protein